MNLLFLFQRTYDHGEMENDTRLLGYPRPLKKPRERKSKLEKDAERELFKEIEEQFSLGNMDYAATISLSAGQIIATYISLLNLEVEPGETPEMRWLAKTAIIRIREDITPTIRELLDKHYDY